MGSTDLKNNKKVNGVDKVYVDGPVGSFGEVDTITKFPTAQGDFAYGINPSVFSVVNYSGGGAYGEGGYCVVTSSTDPRGSGAIELRRGLKYASGQGATFRGTALFDTPANGNVQLIGMGNGECGYYFGYLNTSFAILHQDSSKREIRKLTIATPAGTENVTVTLDGETIVVPVVGGTDATQTAYQLTLADYSQVGDGWLVDVTGSDVFFLSARAGSYAGSYSAVGSSVGSLGSFSQVDGGVAPSSDVYLQTQWNIDRMDGSGPSGMILDHQKGNVYQIAFQYLGQGNAFFSIADQETGRFLPVHEIKNSNVRTTPVLRNPNISGLVTSTNSGNTTSVAVKTASIATFHEGVFRRLDPKFSYSKIFNVTSTSNVFRGLVALKVNRVHKGQACFGELDLLRLSATNNAGSASPKSFQIGIIPDAVITGDVNFVEQDPTRSVVSYADLGNGQAITPNTRNSSIYTVGVPSGGGININLEDLDYIFGVGRIIVIGFISADSISNCTLSINWYEQQ